jgi:hypothetical protein
MFIVLISKVVLGFRNFRYEFLTLGEMLECDSADMFTGKFTLMSMGGRVEGRVEGQACADPRVRTLIGLSGNILM